MSFEVPKFTKKTTGVQTAELFYFINETPEQAIARLKQAYDFPAKVAINESRRLITTRLSNPNTRQVEVSDISDSSITDSKPETPPSSDSTTSTEDVKTLPSEESTVTLETPKDDSKEEGIDVWRKSRTFTKGAGIRKRPKVSKPDNISDTVGEDD